MNKSDEDLLWKFVAGLSLNRMWAKEDEIWDNLINLFSL